MKSKYIEAAKQIKVILTSIGQEDEVFVVFMPGDEDDEDRYFIEIGLVSTNLETVYRV